MKKAIIVALALASAPPAVARCPYGQILRVSMGECVSWHSKLAAGYVHRLVPVRRAHVGQGTVGLSRGSRIARSGFPAAYSAPIEAPEIEALREQLAAPARLTPTEILLSRAAALVPEGR
jgi:hypothetical protein